MIKPRFLPAAEAELLKEISYYSIARDGLGIKFELAVENAVKNGGRQPGLRAFFKQRDTQLAREGLSI